jgi:hypothetical protein
MNTKVLMITLSMSIAIACLLPAQTSLPQTTAPPQPSVPAYEPYQKDEFPEWLIDLRRGEIIFFGSFPFTFFFVTEGYDFFRMAMHNFDSNYAPWPFRNTVLAPYSGAEQAGVIIAAVGFSFAIAVVDCILRKTFVEEESHTVDVRETTDERSPPTESEDNAPDGVPPGDESGTDFERNNE